MTVVVLNALFRSELDGRLPGWVEPRWFASIDDLDAMVPDAEIAWLDTFFERRPASESIRAARRLRWLNTAAAGVDPFPLELLRERGIVLTNGAGVNARAIAEYAVMGMLAFAKGYREVVRAQDRCDWLTDAPGKRELSGSKALIVGAGGIGGRIADLLRPFEVDIVEVRRRPAPGAIGPHEWRGRLGEFDWVIIAVPSTPDTEKLIGAEELAAMRGDAVLLNFARGAVIDQEALVASLDAGAIGGAFLDVTDPEPLPPDHPLWRFDNVHISMHLSGRSQNSLLRRAAERFLDNLGRWERGERLHNVVDLRLGY